MISALLAQVTPIPPTNEWAIAAIIAITPVVVMVLKWVVTNFKARIPSWLVPIIATAVGSAATYLTGVVTENPVLAAAIGLAVIGLREIITGLGRAANVAFFAHKP